MGTRLLLAVAVMMVVVTATFAQPRRWFDLYDEAIQHIRRNEWVAAENKLKQAQQNGPAPGRRVLRTGMFRDDFFPDFYLGVVYLNTNRPKEALQKFQLVRSQNINADDREFLPIVDFEARAQRDAQRLAGVIDKPRPPDPGPVDKPETVKPAEPVAPTPTAPDTAAERKRLEAQFEQAMQGRNIGAARTALLELQKVVPDQKTVAAFTTRVNALDRDIRLAVTERSAMRAFYSGNYQQAVASLNAIEREVGAPLSARGYFYRACGLAAQALRSVQVDSKALGEARRQYAEAMKSRAVIAPDRRYVSPRILQALGS